MNRNQFKYVIIIIVLLSFSGIVINKNVLNRKASIFGGNLNSALVFSTDINLSNADASFIGENNGDKSGKAVAGVGDVNGDGYDDLLIAAQNYNASGGNEGKVYLILGDRIGLSKDLTLSQADASFIGEYSGDYAGWSIAAAGDVNGDNFDDFLIGSPGNDEGDGDDAGKIYLIFGKDTGWVNNINLSNADASFIGEHSLDNLGSSLASAGDVNGDSYDDILIGAYFNDEGGVNAGQTYLILGNGTGWANDVNISQSDASFIGENNGDTSGISIAGGGDVNNDGFDDILIGASNYNASEEKEGKIYVIFGNNTEWSIDVNLSTANASFIGEQASDKVPSSLSCSGDVNNDGFDDILIGSEFNDEGGVNAGQTYLIFGNNSGWSNNVNLSMVDASFIGEYASDYSGGSLAGTGDINGDGYDDVLVGGPGNDEGEGTDAGQTYLIYGKNDGWTMDGPLESANASFIGEHDGDTSGFSIDEAGDVNGDGYNDILIGAYLNDEGAGSNAGQTYLILFPTTSDNPPPINIEIIIVIALISGIAGILAVIGLVVYLKRKPERIGEENI